MAGNSRFYRYGMRAKRGRTVTEIIGLKEKYADVFFSARPGIRLH